MQNKGKIYKTIFCPIFMETLSKQQTAETLNTNQRQTNRLIQYGFLIEKNKKITLESITQYNLAITNLSKYSQDFIKELYVFNSIGTNLKEIVGIKKTNLHEINPIIDYYKIKRKQLLKNQGLFENFQDYFTINETLARLNRKDPRIIYSLINENCLKNILIGPKKINLIERKSLTKLLNPHQQEHFFSTTEAAQQIGRDISIKEIDEICKDNSIGFKFRGTNQENYFLTKKHIKELTKIFLSFKNNI